MESTNIIVRNALKACNFEVDDRVRRRDSGKIGTILEPRRGLGGREAYLVAFDGESKNTIVEREDLVAANAVVAKNGAGYSNYVNARTDFIKKMVAARAAAIEMASAISGFEKDPAFNKEFEKMVTSDSAFAREFVKTVNKFKA